MLVKALWREEGRYPTGTSRLFSEHCYTDRKTALPALRWAYSRKMLLLAGKRLYRWAEDQIGGASGLPALFGV